MVLISLLGSQVHLKADALDNWHLRRAGPGGDLVYAIAYGNSNFVAVGASGIRLTSTNGSNWVIGTFGNSAEKNCIGFGNGYFFTASKFSSMNGDTNNTVIATSASNWMGLFASNYLVYPYGAAHVGGTYFLVGNQSVILTATNFNLSCVGSRTNNCNWVKRSGGGSKNLRGAAYGNGVYVVVGDDVSMTSSNAVTWNTYSVFPPNTAWDVAYGNGVFIALGAAGRFYRSSDGQNWVGDRIGTNYLNRIIFQNGMFVAAGAAGTVVSSQDGMNWKQHYIGSQAGLSGLTFGNGTFAACSIIGEIFQSAPVGIPSLDCRVEGAGGFRLFLSGEIGRGYRIQIRTNLAEGDWEDFLSFTNTSPVMEFLDASVTNLPSRFYRAVSP